MINSISIFCDRKLSLKLPLGPAHPVFWVLCFDGCPGAIVCKANREEKERKIIRFLLVMLCRPSPAKFVHVSNEIALAE